MNFFLSFLVNLKILLIFNNFLQSSFRKFFEKYLIMILFWISLTGQECMKFKNKESIGDDEGIWFIYVTSPGFTQLGICLQLC